jgi:hypothetical protein
MNVIIHDLDDDSILARCSWADFVKENSEAILDVSANVETAEALVRAGGLLFGGGAQPTYLVQLDEA